ncbi:conserved Plasmodium protein, unknown function [Plasmodium gallinaceum]|uniref:Uncharacterized protein n=1 Tax=Plasmodium gallinaceum TaxID=5849 RepID=A0A1J1GNY0_PLAGA|nr:conserved Plasmodium protein, unknown function [Plasmodium gallinaceum]CRG94117.1 conserved Plasmodium protein, unknown function [Plasmodium gallinaceum]
MKIWKKLLSILYLFPIYRGVCLNLISQFNEKYRSNTFYEKSMILNKCRKDNNSFYKRVKIKRNIEKEKIYNINYWKKKINKNNVKEKKSYIIFKNYSCDGINDNYNKKNIEKIKIFLNKKRSKISKLCYILMYKKILKGKYKIKRNKDIIHMIIAPKGSLHEKKNKEILSDPIKNYPWEISIPFHETITCEQSPYYNFLKSEWAYLDYKKDSRKPCGKLEGGLENYDGKGLKLEGGVDRPRYKEIPYHLDHGVEWRKFNQDELIRFDLDPDGNQDQTFLETEEDLENRQWGNWNYNCAKETTQLNSAWRDPVLSKDLSNLIYPWNHKAHENHVIPYGYRGPCFFIPEPKIEWELSARGFFGGYFDDPNWNRIKYYKMTKKLILEWHECAKDDPKIDKIKTELFGISSKKKYNSKQIKLINEHALLRAKEILLDHILDPNNDPDYITYYLDRNEPIDYIGGGNHNCSEKEIKNKTVVLNMCIYPVKQQHESYSLNMSIDEMAEMYHYFMTEIRGEGRTHQSCEDPVEDKYQCYELQDERKKFPALISLYKPLWTNKKYGEEFGDALQEGEKLKFNKFYKFNQKLKLKKKRKLSKKEMEKYNYVDDYEHFDVQYDF